MGSKTTSYVPHPRSCRCCGSCGCVLCAAMYRGRTRKGRWPMADGGFIVRPSVEKYRPYVVRHSIRHPASTHFTTTSINSIDQH